MRAAKPSNRRRPAITGGYPQPTSKTKCAVSTVGAGPALTAETQVLPRRGLLAVKVRCYLRLGVDTVYGYGLLFTLVDNATSPLLRA